MIALLNKGSLKFKNIKIVFIYFIITILSVIFILTQHRVLVLEAKTNEISEKKILLNDTNKKTIEEVLKGIGYKQDEAKKSTDLLSYYFPLEQINRSSYLILPPIDSKVKKFAMNVNGSEAIVIVKKNNIFTAYITSTEIAQEIVSNEHKNLASLEGLLKLEEKKYIIRPQVLVRKIKFKEGNTLSSILQGVDSKKDIRAFINELESIIDLSKVKVGTSGKVIKLNNKIYAIYIKTSKKNVALTFLSSSGFVSKKIKVSLVDSFIEKKIESKSDSKENNITRISLFNSPHLRVNSNILKKGKSFYELLKSYDVTSYEINNLIQSVEPYYNLKKIKAGQTIDIIFNKNIFYGVSYKINKIKELQIIKNRDDFDVYIFEKVYKKELNYKEVTISKNLYVDSKKVELPEQIFIKLVRLLSYSIDFQRDIRKKTTFKIIYEELYDYKNDFIKPGNIIYSKVIFKNKDNLEMFYYKAINTKGEYYDEGGKSIKKTLMRTPIDGARLSSKFGKRRHPILGYNKMHKGLDFAARSGTPIFAAGDGVIERANFYGGYGRYVRIKHNTEYKTAYAHLSRFAKNIKKGNRVKQGSTIGFVGTSGNSTGPHLHYEVILNNIQVNPYNLKMPEVDSLNRSSLNSFKLEKIKILNVLRKLEKNN